MGLNLPVGRYTTKKTKTSLEIYKCGGDSSGCILIGITRTNVGVANSQAAMALFMKRLEAALKLGKVYVKII